METLIPLLWLCFATFPCRAESGPSVDYKKRVEWILGKRHPEYQEFYCEYYGPARATVAEGKKEVYVVCCDWGGKLKSRGVPFMVTRQLFVFDDQKVSEAKESEIRWLDANPIPEKKRSNHLPELKPSAVH